MGFRRSPHMAGWKSGGVALSAGPNFPGTGANDSSYNPGGSQAWTTPSNVTADDSSNAYTSGFAVTSQYLKATNFGFAIPSGATILGIELTIHRRWAVGGGTSGFVGDNRVRIVKGGVVGSTDKASGVGWNTSAFSTFTYGGPTDLWGESWSHSDINASDFGAVLSAIASASDGQLLVDYMQIKVYYST